MTLLSPWDPNYEAKPRPRLVWVSWEDSMALAQGGRMPWEGTEAPVTFLLHRGPAVGQVPRSQAGHCIIPPSGPCTRSRAGV